MFSSGGAGSMAGQSCSRKLQEESTCCICLDYFNDPVLLDCGHNFCQACITKYWGDAPKDATCPQCRKRVQPSSLRLNRQLASMVELVKELGKPLKLEGAGWRVCQRHQEPLKLFCQEDQALICVVCDRSKEHRAHQVVPLEEAAQEYQDQISHSLEILRKERENILVYETEQEKESQDLLKLMETEREKTTAAFRQLRQFLEEQERLLMSQMEEVVKEIARRRDKHLTRLSGELSSIDGLIQELEEKHQQSAGELLQNLGNILERCPKESFENPIAFPVALKWRVHDFSDINPFLNALVKQFQDSLISGLQLQEANVTLDPNTANHKLILSEDLRSVRWRDKRQDLPNNPDRFESYAFVLGHEGFTDGRHCWEVTVGSEGEWAVGVASKSVRRKGKFDCNSEEGIWDMGKWEGQYRASNPPDCPLSLSQELRKIRVTLNCAGGRVAFFNADTGAKLYECRDAPFSGKTLLPSFYVNGKAHLTLLLPTECQDRCA